LNDAWGRVRGLRKTFDYLQSQLHAQMPSATVSRRQSVPPLNWEALHYPLDDRAYEHWRANIEAILADPGTLGLTRWPTSASPEPL
jgi:hypothetical protein